jgi:hypothetical protein
MLRFTSVLVFVLIVGICLAAPATRSEDGRLERSQMSELFGGITPTKTCCLQIAACNVQSQACSIYMTMTACTSGNAADLTATYSKSCQVPTPICTTCSCSDFQNDANGTQYNCVTKYSCSWGGTSCVRGNQSGQVQGFYSCADNCP